MTGTVHETGGGVYRVRLDSGEMVEASLRGRLKREVRTGSKVVIGDRVELDNSGSAWTVESVEERSTQLVRRGKGGRAPKLLAANLDRVFTVVAARDPPSSVELVDRLLVLAESSGIGPVLVINKVDLEGVAGDVEELISLYRGIGYTVLPVSAESGDGLEECVAVFDARVSPEGMVEVAIGAPGA